MTRVRYFLSHWQNWLGLILVLGFVSVSLGAQALSPVDPIRPGAFKRVGRFSDHTPHPPDEFALLGTLPGQIDVYHAIVWGTREAVQFGLAVAAGAFLFGVVFGAVSGYAGGAMGSLMMRVADAFLAFPLIAGVALIQQLVAVTIQSMGGEFWFNASEFARVVYFEFAPPAWVVFLLKVDPLLICLVLFLWMPYARLVNTMVINLKQTDFIQATRALGASPWWVIRRHLVPNSIGPAIVMAARDVGSAVILQATFAFIGLGGNSPWGIMLSMGRNWIIGPGGSLLTYWWLFLPVTLVVILFGITWNLLGDGLNEVLEPKTLAGNARPKPALRKRGAGRPGLSLLSGQYGGIGKLEK